MTGHGPDAETFEKAAAADTSKPHYIENTMAFMFETRLPIRTRPASRSRPPSCSPTTGPAGRG
jgi:homogentisate 1,2-dioxygenase